MRIIRLKINFLCRNEADYQRRRPGYYLFGLSGCKSDLLRVLGVHIIHNDIVTHLKTKTNLQWSSWLLGHSAKRVPEACKRIVRSAALQCLRCQN